MKSSQISWIAIVQKADGPLSFDDLGAAAQGSSPEEFVAMARPVTNLLPNEADRPHARAIGIFDPVVGLLVPILTPENRAAHGVWS
jgi:hypothetical protein